jgi:adenine deaminase
LPPRRAGCLRKTFPLAASGVPPTAWEGGGGRFGEAEQAARMANFMVPGLDAAMAWPAVQDARRTPACEA